MSHRSITLRGIQVQIDLDADLFDLDSDGRAWIDELLNLVAKADAIVAADGWGAVVFGTESEPADLPTAEPPAPESELDTPAEPEPPVAKPAKADVAGQTPVNVEGLTPVVADFLDRVAEAKTMGAVSSVVYGTNIAIRSQAREELRLAPSTNLVKWCQSHWQAAQEIAA